MGMELKLTEKELVNLFLEKVKRIGDSKSGVYNPTDPTHHEKTIASFHFDQGNYISSILNIELNDITWGIEITFSEDTPNSGEQELAFGSWDPRDGEWNFFRGEEAFFELMKNVLVKAQEK